MKQLLRDMRDGHEAALHRFEKPEYWQTMSEGLHISENPVASHHGKATATKQAIDAAHQLLDEKGFFALREMEWTPALPFAAIKATLKKLKSHGWPSVFVLLFDEMWQLVDSLYDHFTAFLGPNPSFELDYYCWALEAGPSAGYVGAHFPRPHRDVSFKDSTFPNGTYRHLGAWIPLVDVNPQNGCMQVLPKDCDPLFNTSDVEHHMECATLAPSSSEIEWEEEYQPHVACAEAVPAPAGSLLTWAANLIHWSAPCEASQAEPRISVATTFYREGEGESSEQGILYRHQLPSVNLRKRLQIVARAMIMYHHWHPGFKGFPEMHLKLGADVEAA